jgi:hypothetical protein
VEGRRFALLERPAGSRYFSTPYEVLAVAVL